MNQEILDKILSKFRSEEPITTSDLIRYGLTPEEIKNLIEDNMLRETSEGIYEFISVEDIYNHGLSLLSENYTNRAKYCFKKCYELNKEHTGAIKELLYIYAATEEYFALSELLKELKNNPNFIPTEDISLYQYLFNIATSSIEKYHNTAQFIPKSDILLPEDKVEENKIREQIYEDKLLPAMHSLNTLNNKDKKQDTIERKTLKELLSSAISENQRMNKKLIQLAKEERYNEIATYLDRVSQYKNIKISDKYAIFLANNIQYIIRTKEIPIATLNPDTTDMFKAMEDYDFELAKSLNDDYLERYNLTKENLLTILLIKINELIKEIKEKNNLESTSNNEITQPEPINVEPVSITAPANKEPTIKLTDVIVNLLQGDIEKFTELLKKYLKEKGYEEYEYLIIKLIKISILNNDKSFLTPITILTEIERKTYTFDVSIYIQQFYNSLSLGKLEETEIYLEIISKYYKESNLIVDNLTNTLNETKAQKEALERLSAKTISEKIDNLIEDKRINSISTTHEERELLKSKINELKNKGNTIGIIKNIPWERRKKIHAIAREFDNLLTYGIGEEPKLIILRLTDPNQERIVFKEVLDDFFRGNKSKNYQHRIDSALKLLKDKRFEPTKHKDPRAFFGILGKLYLGVKDIENAITFLTIANEYNKINKEPLRKYDYTEILEELMNPQNITEAKLTEITPVTTTASNKQVVVEEPVTIPKENNQPIEETKTPQPSENEQSVESTIIEKTPDTKAQEQDINIEKLEEIAYYISSTKMSIENAIREYNLTDEQVQLIRLIYARDYYIEGVMLEGDKILKQVEKDKNKNKQVREMLNEIKRDRLFYKNRPELKQRRRTVIIQKH